MPVRVEKVVETEEWKTIIRYSEDEGLIIKQYALEREDGVIFSKEFFGMVNLEREEISVLKEVLDRIKERDGSE